jgi:glycosyltransferase involved in cell wall biosynthesis
MRITFVSPTVDLGGGTRVIVAHAKALERRGHVVRIVSLPPRLVPFRRKVKSFLKGNGWPGDPGPPVSHLDGSGLDHHVLERNRPVTDDDVPGADVVIATWWETAEWVYALAASKGTKVYFIQGYEVFPFLPIDRVHNTYRLPMHKIVVAKWLANLMAQRYGDRFVDVVPNSVDRKLFFAEERGKQPVPTVGFVYSPGSIKGADVTLQAIARLRQKLDNLRVISFGAVHPPPALALDSQIQFQCTPRQEDIRLFYAQCDAWIIGSRSEGFSLPALEAMACRTPVVATRTGWPEEAITSGENGVLVDVDDLNGLVSGVESVLSLPDVEWRRLSRNAYETAAAGSWEESARKFESALLHACRRSMDGEIAGLSAFL